MTHKELQDLFIINFTRKNPGVILCENHSGKTPVKKNVWIPYGMPSSGGGSDLMAFYPGAVVKFYEVKTLAYPTLSAKQVRWADMMTRLGFEYYVVKELKAGGYDVIYYRDY